MSRDDIATVEGKLLDELGPYFLNTKGIRCLAKFNPRASSKERAEIEILEDSELRDYQQSGLSKLQLESLMSKLHHAKPKENK